MRRACCPRAFDGPGTTAVLAALVTAGATPAVAADSVELPVVPGSLAPGEEHVTTSARSAEADPGGLRRSTEEMKNPPVPTKRLGQDSRHQENDYAGWAGRADDVARQVRPNYQSDNRSCPDVTQCLYEALDALVSAPLTGLEHVESTRTDATDRIRSHGRKTDEALHDDGGQGER